MKYSAGLVKKTFWYLESKKTAKYMYDGLKRKNVIDLVIKENIYQVESTARAKEIANVFIQD